MALRCQYRHPDDLTANGQCVEDQHHETDDFLPSVPHVDHQGRTWVATPPLASTLFTQWSGMMSAARRAALDAYSEVFEPSRKTVGDHQAALWAAVLAAAALLPEAGRA